MLAKRFLQLLIGLILFVQSSFCQAPAAVTPAPAPPRVPLVPMPVAKTTVVPSDLELGEMNIRIGEYSQACKALEEFLSANPNSKDRDRALFHLGIARGMTSDTSGDRMLSHDAFRRLISEFPKSQYRDEAALILKLQSQITELQSQIGARQKKVQ